MSPSDGQSVECGNSDGSAAGPTDQFIPEYQPALPVANSKLGVWLFLSAEVTFFTALISAFIVLRMGALGGIWPTAREAQLDQWVGALSSLVLVFSSVAFGFAIRSARRNRPNAAKRWLGCTMVLGFAFLGIRAFEYGAKFQQGLYPGNPRGLLYDRADIDYLTGLSANCDAQILALERSKTSARATGIHSESVPSPEQARLERLKLIRAGLIVWTQTTVAQTDDPAVREMALARLADQIYPGVGNASVSRQIVNELQAARTAREELESQLQLADEKVVRFRNVIQESIVAMREFEIAAARSDALGDPKAASPEGSGKASVQKRLEEATRASADAAANSSRLRNLIESFKARINALETFSSENGINRTHLLKLPMVIPGGNKWASGYYLLTGIHAIHIMGGLIACLILMMLRLSSSRVGPLENVGQYWCMVSLVAILLFPLLYL